MLTPEQQRQVDVECAREAEWWGQLPDATKALNRYPVALLLRDQVRELEAEVARLRPVVEAALALRECRASLQTAPVWATKDHLHRAIAVAEQRFDAAVDAYRATEAAT